MIITVDDDKTSITPVINQLRLENHKVRWMKTPFEALEFLDTEIPEAVICEYQLAKMDGLEFLQLYKRRYPNRKTPFVFYTSNTSNKNRILAINMGVSAYFVKPEYANVISAKVNSLINQEKNKNISEFYGDLSKMGFVDILHFCEEKLFSGDLVLWIDESMVLISIVSGRVETEEEGSFDSNFEKVMNAKEGMFLLRTRPLDFSELASASVGVTSESKWYEEKKLGKLSFKLVQGNTFQIQTDYFSVPFQQVITRVFCKGKRVFKIVTPIKDEISFDDISGAIEEQHLKVENRIHGDFENSNHKTDSESTEVESNEKRFFRLLNEGLALSNNKEFEAALKIWQEAEKLFPDHSILKMNIRIVKARMGLTS